jgi:hypothetical protein
MSAARLQTVARPASGARTRSRFVQARFEALAEWDILTEDAFAIANATEVDILDAVELLRHGCPSDLVLGILG